MSQGLSHARGSTAGSAPRRELRFRIASTAAEFEAIHRLNHATFATEIPQHPANPEGRLVDRYHEDNTYAVCLSGGTVIGMVAGRCTRPFSLDHKVAELDRQLPPHRKAVEIRLLAITPAYRRSAVFLGLVRLIARHFRNEDCDLAVISGTVRQLKLYRHLGFCPFASPVGTAEALYQPMFVTLEALRHGPVLPVRSARDKSQANFLPGPVATRSEVLAACAAPPISHRDASFVATLTRVRTALDELVCAPHVVLMVGTGTLGNETVAAQLRCLEGPGLVLVNGEFGERLADHATRWDLPFTTLTYDWGSPFDWVQLQTVAARCRPRWVWAVLCETSTGVSNSEERLRTLCESIGADLCLDAVSAVGLFPVNLQGVRFATAVSGKGLAGLPGLVAVFHDGRIASAGRVPRYLDLASYEQAAGVPFTHSSNLVAALDRSLNATYWPRKFERVQRASLILRAELRNLGVCVVAPEAVAAPGVVTVALPLKLDSARVAAALADAGIHIAWASAYLRRRNWVQICLMGEFDDAPLRRLPGLLAGELERCLPKLSTTESAALCAARRYSPLPVEHPRG